MDTKNDALEWVLKCFNSAEGPIDPGVLDQAQLCEFVHWVIESPSHYLALRNEVMVFTMLGEFVRDHPLDAAAMVQRVREKVD